MDRPTASDYTPVARYNLLSPAGTPLEDFDASIASPSPSPATFTLPIHAVTPSGPPRRPTPSNRAASREQSAAPSAAIRWNPELCEKLLDFLLDKQRKGEQTDNGSFKQSVWTACASELSRLSSQAITARKAESKYDSYKKIWRWWIAHLNATSGWGRHTTLDIPYTSQEVAEAYYNAHPDRRRFWHKPPEFRSHLEKLFTNQVATGDYAITCEQSVSSLVESDENFDFPSEFSTEGATSSSENVITTPSIVSSVERSVTPADTRIRARLDAPLARVAANNRGSRRREQQEAEQVSFLRGDLATFTRTLVELSKNMSTAAESTAERAAKKFLASEVSKEYTPGDTLLILRGLMDSQAAAILLAAETPDVQRGWCDMLLAGQTGGAGTR